MRKLLPAALYALAVGYVLAHFTVAFYNHWYFADLFWVKVAALTPLLAVGYGALLYTAQRRVWFACGLVWLASYGLAALAARSPDLRGLSFVAVLNLEAAMVWLPAALIWLVYGSAVQRAARRRARSRDTVTAELAARQRRRRRLARITRPGDHAAR